MRLGPSRRSGEFKQVSASPPDSTPEQTVVQLAAAGEERSGTPRSDEASRSGPGPRTAQAHSSHRLNTPAQSATLLRFGVRAEKRPEPATQRSPNTHSQIKKGRGEEKLVASHDMSLGTLQWCV